MPIPGRVLAVSSCLLIVYYHTDANDWNLASSFIPKGWNFTVRVNLLINPKDEELVEH